MCEISLENLFTSMALMKVTASFMLLVKRKTDEQKISYPSGTNKKCHSYHRVNEILSSTKLPQYCDVVSFFLFLFSKIRVIHRQLC